MIVAAMVGFWVVVAAVTFGVAFVVYAEHRPDRKEW